MKRGQNVATKFCQKSLYCDSTLDGLPDSFIWLADAKNHIIDGPPCSNLLNDNETVAGGGAGKCSGDTIDHVLTTKSPTRSTSTSSTQSLFVSEDEVKSRIMLIKLSFLWLSVVPRYGTKCILAI